MSNICDYISQKHQACSENVKVIKYKDKYPRFDDVALNKKLQPYSANSIKKIIDQILKMIEETLIVERIPEK